MSTHRTALPALAGVLYIGLAAHAAELPSSHHNGQLTWTNPQPGTAYAVQWAPAPTGTWQEAWSGLDSVTGATATLSARVPMAYRVLDAPRIEALTDVFSVPAGANRHVAGTTRCSHDAGDGEFYYGTIEMVVTQDLSETTTTNEAFQLVKQFDNLDTRIHHVYNEVWLDNLLTGLAWCRVIFNYDDATASTVTLSRVWYEPGPAETAGPAYYTNESPAKIVTDIEVWLRCQHGTDPNNTAHERNDALWIYEQLDETRVDLALPAMTGTVTHTMLYARTPNREPGDDVSYALQDGSQWVSNLTLNVRHPLSGLLANPTTLRVVLTPVPVGPQPETPSVSEVLFLYWMR